MERALQDAAMNALADVQIMTGNIPSVVERAEYIQLRELRTRGLYRPLAARLAMLVTLGWRRTDIAEAMDVSRVTLANWLRDHTDGASTFDAYLDDESPDYDALYRDSVLAPIPNRLNDRAGEQLACVRFEHDKFIVPRAFVSPIRALWRVAYRSRGAELTSDGEVMAASDTLDVMISLMLRRGVTNIAIARAAGVTHRAVLDRMNRARSRGLLLDCDDGCEAFIGERQLREHFGQLRASALKDGDWVDLTVEDAGPLVPVRLTSSRPSRYWLQTMIDGESGDEKALFRIYPDTPSAKYARTRLTLACGVDAELDLGGVSLEAAVAARLGRMSEESPLSKTVADRFRSSVMLIPGKMLYTERSEASGLTPSSMYDVLQQIPDKLWLDYFAKHELVWRCFDAPETVIDEYAPTTKHADDAKTRKEVAV